MNTYRPTVEDFRPTKTQQLSCREAGQFDHKQQHAPTRWTVVSTIRHNARHIFEEDTRENRESTRHQ